MKKAVDSINYEIEYVLRPRTAPFRLSDYILIFLISNLSPCLTITERGRAHPDCGPEPELAGLTLWSSVRGTRPSPVPGLASRGYLAAEPEVPTRSHLTGWSRS